MCSLYAVSVNRLTAIAPPPTRLRVCAISFYRCDVTVKDFVTNALIHDNMIENCGVHDFQYDDGGKNGEGICEC